MKIVRGLLFILLAGCTTVCPLTSLNASIFLDNPNFVIDVHKHGQFTLIGELVSSLPITSGGKTGISQGTAFLVSPCYVLTAAHVIFGDNQHSSPESSSPMSFKLIPQDTGGFVTADLVMLKLMLYNEGSDWALLKLPDNRCIGIHPKLGWYEPLDRRLFAGERVLAAGYSSNYRDKLSISEGSVRSVFGDGQLTTDAAFSPGSSGGPVFIMEEGKMMLAGMITSEVNGNNSSTYQTYSRDHGNRFQSIVDILGNPAVRVALDADRRRFNVTNPALSRLAQSWPNAP